MNSLFRIFPCLFVGVASVAPPAVIPLQERPAIFPSSRVVSKNLRPRVQAAAAAISSQHTTEQAPRFRGKLPMLTTRTNLDQVKSIETMSTLHKLLHMPSKKWETIEKNDFIKALPVQSVAARSFVVVAAFLVAVAGSRWWSRRADVSGSEHAATEMCTLGIHENLQESGMAAVQRPKIVVAALAGELLEIRREGKAETCSAVGMSVAGPASESRPGLRLAETRSGFWDPIGIGFVTGVDVESYKQFHEAEITHGRLCTLAIVGSIMPNRFKFHATRGDINVRDQNAHLCGSVVSLQMSSFVGRRTRPSKTMRLGFEKRLDEYTEAYSGRERSDLENDIRDDLPSGVSAALDIVEIRMNDIANERENMKDDLIEIGLSEKDADDYIDNHSRFADDDIGPPGTCVCM